MSTFGVDYTSADAACLKQHGVRFVCRYIAPPGHVYDWKRITSQEVDKIRKLGLGLVLVFESSASRALTGYNGGLADGQVARDTVIRLGVRPDAVVYFAVDFDAAESQQALIDRYLQGAAKGLGNANRVGVYAGFHVVKRCLNHGVARYAWQTYAWSGGQWDPRAQLQQYSNGHRLCGASVDYDRAVKTDYGNVLATKPKPPKHKPYKLVKTRKDDTTAFEEVGKVGVLFNVQQFLRGQFKALELRRN